jgi:hypothetical protein
VRIDVAFARSFFDATALRAIDAQSESRNATQALLGITQSKIKDALRQVLASHGWAWHGTLT